MINNSIVNIHFSESLYISKFAERLGEKLLLECKYIFETLNIKKMRKIDIYLYEEMYLFKNDVIKYYKDSKMPKYCKGTIHDGKIFFLVEKGLDSESYRYEVELRRVVHEYIHIVYQERIVRNKRRITWIDEGLALNLSKEKGKFKRDKYPILNSSINEIDLNQLSHEENTFVTNEIDGYEVSYLSLKYILDTYSNEEFNKLIRNNTMIKKIRKDHLDKRKSVF